MHGPLKGKHLTLLGKGAISVIVLIALIWFHFPLFLSGLVAFLFFFGLNKLTQQTDPIEEQQNRSEEEKSHDGELLKKLREKAKRISTPSIRTVVDDITRDAQRMLDSPSEILDTKLQVREALISVVDLIDAVIGAEAKLDLSNQSGEEKLRRALQSAEELLTLNHRKILQGFDEEQGAAADNLLQKTERLRQSIAGEIEQ